MKMDGSSELNKPMYLNEIYYSEPVYRPKQKQES